MNNFEIEDLEDQQNNHKVVVLALVINHNGEILAVSRKNDTKDFGFPGGKVEDGEHKHTALKRELLEETGLVVTPTEMIYSAVDSNGYLCKLYVCDYYSTVNYFNPPLIPAGVGESGVVKWMSIEDFLRQSFSHPDYNNSAINEFYNFQLSPPTDDDTKYFKNNRTGEVYKITHIDENGWMTVYSSFGSRPITMPMSFLFDRNSSRVKAVPRVMYEYSSSITADMQVNPNDYPIDEVAKVLAINWHNVVLQEYDDNMYSKHLADVIDVFDRFSYLIPSNYHRLVKACLWCHDVVEDTRKTFNDVKRALNEFVADGSYAMTNEKGRNRRERANAKYYQGLREFTSAGSEEQELELGEFMKLCDRIANVLNGLKNGKMVDSYMKEQDDFRNKLRSRKNPDKYKHMWDFLDNILVGNIKVNQNEIN